MKITYIVDMVTPCSSRATAIVGERALVENACFISLNSEKFKLKDDTEITLSYAFEIINHDNGLFLDYYEIFSVEKRNELKQQAGGMFLKMLSESPI